jgi:hypothetical protein
MGAELAMNRHLAVTAAAVVVTALAGPGYAATKAKPAVPKPSCLMLTDPSGDAKIAGQGNNYAVDDIVSADVATGTKTIVGVLRLASGDTASGIPTGATYELKWTQTGSGAGGQTSTFTAAFFFYVYASGEVSGSYGTSTDPNMPPQASSPVTRATLDANGVITWVLNRKDAAIAKGTTFSHLTAATRIALNYKTPGGSGNSSTGSMDDAAGRASYTDRQRSCVRAA